MELDSQKLNAEVNITSNYFNHSILGATVFTNKCEECIVYQSLIKIILQDSESLPVRLSQTQYPQKVTSTSLRFNYMYCTSVLLFFGDMKMSTHSGIDHLTTN